MYGSFYVAEVEQCDWSEVRSSYGDKSVKISPGFLGVLVLFVLNTGGVLFMKLSLSIAKNILKSSHQHLFSCFIV